ncbi:hypothetical protein [Ramlibacter tataouinensis]|uniref:Uncharacterized protein n=1 Tax=Ramlibacter tataouinensis (strain ATCC BAA-407 / DSM 14655 / LMG 21543 / TTB310) TaxID=365046 RepID=F5XXX5_RAMTT|nr:hypothetical protein [Ramlibacter tataouinensis]AEG93110.1 hypothetical protein Rta_20170 [Ramlibacter tataouinensis TTB310]
MSVQVLSPVAAIGYPVAPPQREGGSIQDVVLRHLKTPAEIASVLHLREEIDLSVHAAAGPQFAVLEKKETSAVWCSASTLRAIRSARSASCPWAIS